MGLSTELISEFVKITNDNKKGKEDNTVYGTVKTVSEDGKAAMVKIDGSDELTPVTTTCSIRGEDNSDPDNPYPGDRVRLTVRNHSAIVTGNVSDQSIGVKRAGAIEASIKNLGDSLEFQVSDKEGSLASKITMVSNRIESEVLDTTNGNSLASKITQMPDQIVNKVASTYITNEGGINSKITDFSEFKQTVEGFSFMGKGGTVKITGGQIDATGLKLTGEGAEININDVFKVSSTGVVTWSSSNSPTKAQYSKNGTSGWHDTYASTDYYARYSYDGGTTWTSAILIQGKNGTNGKDGEDGADAEIPDGWAIFDEDDEKTYIDGEMIYSDSIYADSIHLGGWLKVYKTKKGSTIGGYLGYDSGFNSTYGIGMQAYNSDAECICTDEAARLSYGTTAQFIASNSGYAYVQGAPIKFKVNGTDRFVMQLHDSTYVSLRPNANSTSSFNYHLGNSSFKWGALYATNGTIQTSDRNEKNSIEDLPDKYLALFDRLRPVRYKMNEGSSGRYHVGYIAQEVEEAMSEVGLDSLEFGGFVKDKSEAGDDMYMLRYDEFDAIRDAKIKQLEARNAELEARIDKLEKLLTQNT